MMKRFLILTAALLVLCLTLTACGKSEEEQAANEIYEHMKEEAAADGVDLVAVLEEEMEAYEERHEQWEEEQAAAQDFQALIDAALPDITAAYTRYTTATTGAEIRDAAETYNELYFNYMALAQDDTQKGTLLSRLDQAISTRRELFPCIYETKAAYADYADKGSVSEVRFYFDRSTDNGWMVLMHRDETTWMFDSVKVLHKDGSVFDVNLASVTTETTSSIDCCGINADGIVLNVVDNADFLYFLFPLNDSTAAGVSYHNEMPEYYESWYFDGTMEDLFYNEKTTVWFD